MKDMFEIADLIANEFRKDPRNKAYANEELILASIFEETGQHKSVAELHDLIDKYQRGELSSEEEEIYDAASFGCGILARKCFAEDPEDEDADIDYEIFWLVNDNNSISAEIQTM